MDTYDKIIREIEKALDDIDAHVIARYTPEGNKTYHRLGDARLQLLAMINDLKEIRHWRQHLGNH